MLNPFRALARPALASMFVVGGADAVMNPEPKAPPAEDVVDPIQQQVSALDALDTPEVVRLNGAIQVLGGLLLATNKLPRLASAVLAASLVPTTLAGHRYWEVEDPEERANQQVHFFKNVSMLGGLVLSAWDTQGEPGAAWRAKHAAEHAALEVDHAKEKAGLAKDVAAEKAKRVAAEAGAAGVAATAGTVASAKLAKQRVKLEGKHVKDTAGTKTRLAAAEAKLATAEARNTASKAKQRVETEAKHQADTAGTRTELLKKKLTPDVADAKRLVSAIRSDDE